MADPSPGSLEFGSRALARKIEADPSENCKVDKRQALVGEELRGDALCINLSIWKSNIIFPLTLFMIIIIRLIIYNYNYNILL